MPRRQNLPPVANAGPDQHITTPVDTTSAVLDGTASRDPEGRIVSFAWRRVAGPGPATIVSPGHAQSAVLGLSAGTHTFGLTVTDSAGSSANDTVAVVVTRTPNQGPVADAGPDQIITVRADSASVLLDGSRSRDPDGALVAWRWQQSVGPSCVIVSPSTAQTMATGLTPGDRVFQLTVTDAAGAMAVDSMVVRAEAVPNVGPFADAGADREITLATASSTAATVLDGSNSRDADGAIAAFAWSRVAGPGAVTIVSPALAQTVATGLAVGTHEFGLRVTDDQGSTSVDSVVVCVVLQQAQGPVARAGRDVVLVVPANAATLDGSASTAAGGSLLRFCWEQVGGPAEGCAHGHARPRLALSGLVVGGYKYRLTVTDDRQATASDDVTVTVRRPSR